MNIKDFKYQKVFSERCEFKHSVNHLIMCKVSLFLEIYIKIIDIYKIIIYICFIDKLKKHANMIQNNLIKGTLNPIILKLLSENKRMYGYEITQKVKELTNGKIELTFGALYPILHKLEQEGVVKTESEVINNRNRIYYSLTETGKSTAKERIEELEDFVNSIKALLQPNMGLQYVHVK